MDLQTLLVLGLAGWAAGYAAACRIWPYAACRRCAGKGKLMSPSGRKWRDCPRCRATGRRLRTGRRVINAWMASTRASR